MTFKLNDMRQLVFLFLFFPSLVLAQVELSLSSCKEMALQNSQQLRIADRQQQKAIYEVRRYRADFYPKVSLVGLGFYHQRKYDYSLKGGYLPVYKSGNDGKLEPDVMINPETLQPLIGSDGQPIFNLYAFLPDMKLQLNLRGIYSTGVQLEQPIYWGGKIRIAHQMAEIGEDIATKNVRFCRSEVLLETEQAYWQLLREEEQLLAVQKYRAVLQELLKNLQEAEAVGMVTSNETLKAMVRYNEANLMVQQSQNGRTLARMNLCRLVGLSLETELHLQDSLSEQVDPQIWQWDTTIQARPDYDLLKYEVELKSRQVVLQRADFLPQLGISLGYGYSGGLKLNGEGENGATLMALATLKIPIFYGGAGRHKVRSARMDEEISQLNLDKSVQLMQLEVASARYNLQDAQYRVVMARQALAQANENLKVSTDQYQVGTENLAALLEAQAQWQNAYSQWIDAKALLHVGVSIYLKSIGKLE